MIAGKQWGHTTVLLAVPQLEVHRIFVKGGGKCSEHKHDHKFNAFYVIRGSLNVRTWKNSYDLVDLTTIGPGELHVVEPGEFHQFEAVTDVEALELYYAAGLDPRDIVRRSVGSAPA